MNIDISDFPELREDMFLPVPKTATFGRAMKDLFYKKTADYIITNTNPPSGLKKTVNSINPSRIIVDFFYWDYILDRYRYFEKYRELLKFIKSFGINKCVGIDFSLWYGQPAPSLFNNLYMNFIRLKEAQDMGFYAAFNWNNIMPQFKDVYIKCLPEKIPLVVMDNNHGEYNEKIIGMDLLSLQMFCDMVKVDYFVIQTSRDDISYMRPFLEELKKKDISYTFVPSQTKMMPGVVKAQKSGSPTYSVLSDRMRDTPR